MPSLALFYSTHPLDSTSSCSVPRMLGRILEETQKRNPTWQIDAVSPAPAQVSGIATHGWSRHPRHRRINQISQRVIKHDVLPRAGASARRALQEVAEPDIAVVCKTEDALLVRDYWKNTTLLHLILSIPFQGATETGLRGLQAVDWLMMNSAASYDYLLQQYMERFFHFPPLVWISPTMIDLAEFRPAGEDERRRLRGTFNIDEDALVICHVGGAQPIKGQHVGREAVRLLDNVGRKVVYLCAGDSRPERVELAPNVTMVRVGRLPYAEIPNVYRAADLGVVPILCWDNGPGVLLEMMACGLPVVASKLGGVNWFMPDDAGVKIDRPNEVHAWRDALSALIPDLERRDRYSRRGRQEAEARWEQEAGYDAYSEFFRSLVSHTQR